MHLRLLLLVEMMFPWSTPGHVRINHSLVIFIIRDEEASQSISVANDYGKYIYSLDVRL